jgi:nitrite reductase (NADH) small subunit
MEAEVEGLGICLANVNGTLSALDNACPHRQGPLGQEWLEGEAVVCPWHSWTFSLKTGLSEYPVHERVDVFAVRVEGEDVLVNLEPEPQLEVEHGLEQDASVAVGLRSEGATGE